MQLKWNGLSQIKQLIIHMDVDSYSKFHSFEKSERKMKRKPSRNESLLNWSLWCYRDTIVLLSMAIKCVIFLWLSQLFYWRCSFRVSCLVFFFNFLPHFVYLLQRPKPFAACFKQQLLNWKYKRNLFHNGSDEISSKSLLLLLLLFLIRICGIILELCGSVSNLELKTQKIWQASNNVRITELQRNIWFLRWIKVQQKYEENWLSAVKHLATAPLSLVVTFFERLHLTYNEIFHAF